MTAILRAVQERLADEHEPVLASPLSRECAIVFVVPVYDESEQRFLELLTSLADQWVGVSMEVIAVVNNAPDDHTDRWRGSFARNQALLDLPVFRNGRAPIPGTAQTDYIRKNLPVYAIDHSSPGCWIDGSNVGRARRSGLNEAALRFCIAGRNGLVVHTDADCRFDDAQFVSKVLRLFAEDPTLVGLAGTNNPEFDRGDPEAKELAGHLPDYLRFRRYMALAKTVRAGVAAFDAEKPLGRCIVHRAFEGVLAGGVDPIALAEDLAFGDKLKAYARENGMHFAYGRRWNIGPVSALRVSDRTPNNVVRRFLDARRQDGSLLVEDVLHPGESIVLDDEYVERVAAAVRGLPGGRAQLEYLFVTSSLANTTERRHRMSWRSPIAIGE